MRLTDWLGNEYGEGDTVIYPVGSGRSIEMQQATVLDIWTVYQCPDEYKWKRLEEGADVPHKKQWNPDTREYEPGPELADTQLRVRLQPNGKGSRDFHTRTDSKTIWIDPNGNDIDYWEMMARLEAEHGPQYEGSRLFDARWRPHDLGYGTRREAVTPKPVTLTQGIDNITLLKRADRPDKCPTCDSPRPELHPAVQSEGEVQICRNAWHNTK